MQDSPLWWILSESPLLLVWVAGILMALVRWQRHPRVSLLTILVLGMFCAEAVLLPIIYRIVPSLLEEIAPPSTSSLNDRLLIFQIMGFCRAVLNAGLYILLLLAVFGGRGTAPGFKQEWGSGTGAH